MNAPLGLGTALAVVGLGSLLAAAVVMTVTALVARRQNRVAVVDVAWGTAFVVIGLVCAVLALLTGEPGRAWLPVLVAVLVGIWGGRLAWHIGRRSHGGGEDPRYRRLLGGSLAEVGLWPAVRKVFGLQGVVAWLVALPLQAGAVGVLVAESGTDAVRWPVVVVPLGVAVWLFGLVFEAVGDAQLAAYKRDPDRPPVLQTGLWAWTRHPNYFGDACVWWGLWLAGGLAAGPVAGAVTLVAPVAMTYFLAFATGARLLEREMMKRPGYPQYAERTSMFLPRPPRR